MFDFLKKKNVSPQQNVQEKHIFQERANVTNNVKRNKTYFEKSVEAAQRGNVVSAAHVGVSFHYGIEVGDEEHPQGLQPNVSLAIKYLNIAAQRGFLKAQLDLGLLYSDDDSPAFNPQEGLKWIMLTAQKGDAFSQHMLGYYYSVGKLLPRDEEKAYYWFLESAFNGDKFGMHELAKIYSDRTSQLLDKEDMTAEERQQALENSQLAFKWQKNAADLGLAEAMYYTGVYYFAGYGVDEDIEKSIYYIDLAIDNGFEPAIDFKNEHFAEADL